ncbi:MAG: nodulation protein NodH [Sediminimonas qiaohouensis]|uniref:Nodulation protein NodH n=1 Tax=Sediminimonas qiaohouensis TaxID=552061 RepID=A0A7C9LNS8_9RHOB|nr:sulfotransferase family 2 domain-containing protein [Sediminimonas qiaohouensis]MTJ04660.1 nodulation protein NodH [Sediminimonas qiaohouensis]
MSHDFDYFIVFAEMRTGSNFLETNLNAYPGLNCHGEAFNPHFIGYPKSDDILGVTQSTREVDPQALITAIRDQPGTLGGFRYFHDHDARVMDIALPDPRCAKIILTRNPVDSYVSWKIAQQTGQWKLTNVKRRKDALAEFDAQEFQEYLNTLQSFQVRLLNALQTTGQTAFYIAYEDLQNVDVINGLARFLGEEAQLSNLDRSLKPQNPEPISSKVDDFDAMREALAQLDVFNLGRTPSFEPRRGPAVPSYVAGAKAPLLYLPVRSGPEDAVQQWMAELDHVDQGDLTTQFTQKTLRQWKRNNPGHRSFTVLRHPVARAHAAFCQRILNTGPGSFTEIRKTLRRVHNLPLPGKMPDERYDAAAHRRAFVAFLKFLKANLAGQTGLRIDSAWGTQMQALQDFSRFAPPDVILREDEIASALPSLAHSVGYFDAVAPRSPAEDEPFALREIYDDRIEDLAAKVYQRDYVNFGFTRWG